MSRAWSPWSDPAARLALLERVGADEYNRLQQAEWERNTVSTINGYPIRRLVDARWGPLFLVVGTGRAFAEQQEAERYAAEQKKCGSCNVELGDTLARHRGFCSPCWYGKEPA
jgi:hypothetical protein